jgi:hypothetical protein
LQGKILPTHLSSQHIQFKTHKNMANEFIEKTKAKTVRVTKTILWLSLIALLIGAIGYYLYRDHTFSEGTRSGALVKISKKGWIFKTYEGELNLSGTGGMMTPTSVWTFSANEAAFQQLQKLEGKNVSCHYLQKVQAFPWQGDTDYIVDEAKLVQ